MSISKERTLAWRVQVLCTLAVLAIFLGLFLLRRDGRSETWYWTLLFTCAFFFPRCWFSDIRMPFSIGGEWERSLRRSGQKTYIEFLRIAAAFLVIVNHTNNLVYRNIAPSPTWLCSLTYFFVCKVAVPLFLFIMGALLLGKEDTPKKSAERLLRIFAVFAAGSLIYYVYYHHQNGWPLSVKEFLLSLPRSQATNAFWYLYLYLALLCVLPILQRLAKSLTRRQLEYLLFLSLGVLGTAPLISIFFPSFALSGYFTAGLIGPYIGQVLLGYYIERYVPMTKPVFLGALCSFVLLIAFQVGGAFLLYQRDPSAYYALDDRTLITITGAAACFYICVKYLFLTCPPRPCLERAVCRLGRLTFGAYLLGDMVITQSLPLYSALSGHMHPMAAMVLWEALIFTACSLLTAGLRLVPFLRKWL